MPLLVLAWTTGCGASAAGEGDSAVSSTRDTGGVLGDALSDQGAGASSGGTSGGGTSGGDAGASSGGSSGGADGGGASSGGSSDGDGGASSSGGADGDALGDVGLPSCPGDPDCTCEQNTDCDSGLCIEMSAGKVCARTCVDSCPSATTCTKYDPGSGDSVYICTDDHLSLCAPCHADADCQIYGDTALCLDYGAQGRFCGSACKTGADCPSGYACADVPIGGGNTKKQCRLEGAKSVCSCSQWAIDKGRGTSCSTGNALGICEGTRSCAGGGLSACDAPAAVTESCDGVDNDCNGQTDDIDPVAFDCVHKAWFAAGSKSACKTDGDCQQAGESCADDTKTCRKLIGACPGEASCAKGKLVCTGGKLPKQEMCNGEDDDCDGKVDEDYGWTNPASGGTAGVGASCGLGACAGGTVKCETLSAAVCDTESVNKAEKDTCNGQDDDCDGATDEGACDDGNACTTDTCDAAKVACESTAAVDCDDANPCTADSCDAQTGQCGHAFAAASCDDGNACTDGDECIDQAGKAVCAPGTAKDCDDGNVCTDDGCDPDKGCSALPNAVTRACYSDQNPATEGVGTCVAGVQACKDGLLRGECAGEVLPATKEACDGRDDDCDGATDEGCKGARIDAGFASAAAIVAGKGRVLGLVMPVDGSGGALVSDQKYELYAGLRARVMAWLGK